jgi:hypothetical protein
MAAAYLAPATIGGRAFLAPLLPPAAISTPPVSDGVAPTFTGSLAHTKTASSITIDWSGATSSDNVAVARREYRIGGSGPYSPASSAEEASKRHTFAVLSQSTPYKIEVRCVDTNENVSLPLTIVVTTSAAPAPGGDGFSHIRYDLVSKGDVPHLNLATLDWSLFAQLRVKDLSAPVAQGTHAMVTGSPALDIAVPKVTVPAGWYFLVLSDADGTTTVACPVLVS